MTDQQMSQIQAAVHFRFLCKIMSSATEFGVAQALGCVMVLWLEMANLVNELDSRTHFEFAWQAKKLTGK
jgi:hypothetical protein